MQPRTQGQSGADAAAPRKVLIVDGTNALYRAFFAVPGLRAPDGAPTNAAYGFVNMLAKVTREERPDRVVVVFDARGRNHRHALYPDYKAGREAQPEDLSAQIPLVREIVAAQGLPCIEAPGVEADDVIATLVERLPGTTQVAVVSTDKDLMQLVSERVTLLDGMKDRRFDPAAVRERYGVGPEQMLDLRALIGDPSDNIPGVKGIGEKGAAKLLAEWGGLESLIAQRAHVTPNKARAALAEHYEAARLSKRLSTLRRDAPLPFDPLEIPAAAPDRERLRALYERAGFTRLLETLGAAPEGVPEAGAASGDFPLFESARDFAAWWREQRADEPLALFAVLGPDATALALPRALGCATASGAACCVALDAGGETLAEIARAFAAARPALRWQAWGSKAVQSAFAQAGAELPLPDFDPELAAQLIDAGGPVQLAALAGERLGRRLRSWEDLAGRGAKARSAEDVPHAELAPWAIESARASQALCAPLGEVLRADALESLYCEVELPLTAVLSRMECSGVRIDEAALRRLSREYNAELERIAAEIQRLAGEEFLISSPKQLQRILFEKLRLPPVKKTKTGYSTDEEVLEQLASQHELPAQVLAHRKLAKLKNTYVDALPQAIDPRSGRIHPTFHQLGAATGRLSATRPNVQNIPIRTPEGVRIREAFVPAEGCRLVSADYSQVELRILAHYSRDESLIDSFARGEDVHRRTAAEVAGIAPEAVSDEQRARAKAVNFGIIYGSSAYGLAQQLGIAAAEAQATIDAYFERYRGVRRFLDETIETARAQGFVTTWLGRRRYLPDLASRNRTLRQAAERMAVNSVIQGTAADLIKRAMLAVDALLRADAPGARMILQVHDELVIEAPAADAAQLAERIARRMEGVLSLRVPLVVQVGIGHNWREAH